MRLLMMRVRLSSLILLGICFAGPAQEVLPHTQLLISQGDLSTQMVAGIDQLLPRGAAHSIAKREKYWQRDFSSAEAYDKSVQPNRERLRAMVGAVDARLPVTALELVSSTASPAKAGETELFTVEAVRWPVFEGVHGEGLRLQPRGEPVACIVAIPDADQTPEMLAGLAPGLAPERQFARRLAESGCEVLVPVLIDRQDASSGNARINCFTNQSHREWICRRAFPMGRHIIGYEAQKVAAAVDFFVGREQKAESRKPKIGVAGYGEGGLMAFYAAALDRRIEAALVSGYFDSRQRLWEEPIYRNVFGLLREFGDAEIASLIAPRALIVEYSAAPTVAGPPPPREGRAGAASGRLQTPEYASVEAEFERARALLRPANQKDFDRFKLITGAEGMTTGPGSDRALIALLNALGVPSKELGRARLSERAAVRSPDVGALGETRPATRPGFRVGEQPAQAPVDLRPAFDFEARQQRQLKELEEYTQALVR